MKPKKFKYFIVEHGQGWSNGELETDFIKTNDTRKIRAWLKRFYANSSMDPLKVSKSAYIREIDVVELE